jgi:hypothetical protein
MVICLEDGADISSVQYSVIDLRAYVCNTQNEAIIERRLEELLEDATYKLKRQTKNLFT